MAHQKNAIVRMKTEAERNAITILLNMVTARRTLIEFTIAEKFQKTYRIKSNTWNAAKKMIDNTHENGGRDGGIYSDSEYEQQCYYEVDGTYEHLDEFKPQLERKVKQVKIGNTWHDVNDIEADPVYILESHR